MTWLPRHAPVFVYWQAGGIWQAARLSNDEWSAIIKRNQALSWALWDPCRHFLEDSIRNEWAALGKRERQARYAEHKAARALRAEARHAKALTI